MNDIAVFVAGFVLAIQKIMTKKWSFLSVFVCIFIASVYVLAIADLLPTAPSAEAEITSMLLSQEVQEVTVAPKLVQLPVSIEIPALELVASIANPVSTNINILDDALLYGAVRYPTSAKLGENGNVVLFGHSSYLPVVGNLAYKTFNDIQKLKTGDRINVSSGDFVHVYAVRSVSKESVNDNRPIPLLTNGKILTLVTCNSFATKSDRFIVVADFVESHPIAI